MVCTSASILSNHHLLHFSRYHTILDFEASQQKCPRFAFLKTFMLLNASGQGHCRICCFRNLCSTTVRKPIWDHKNRIAFQQIFLRMIGYILEDNLFASPSSLYWMLVLAATAPWWTLLDFFLHLLWFSLCRHLAFAETARIMFCIFRVRASTLQALVCENRCGGGCVQTEVLTKILSRRPMVYGPTETSFCWGVCGPKAKSDTESDFEVCLSVAPAKSGTQLKKLNF